MMRILTNLAYAIGGPAVLLIAVWAIHLAVEDTSGAVVTTLMVIGVPLVVLGAMADWPREECGANGGRRARSRR